MFDRFTDRARKVMGYSRQKAQEWNHDYIGTEHILFGILTEGSGTAVCALKNLGIDLSELDSNTKALMVVGQSMVTMGQLPFTPRSKKVLELALEEAANLGHTYIGTEHMLLGLIRENDGIAAQALKASLVNLDSVRKEVVSIVSGEPPRATPERITAVEMVQSIHVVNVGKVWPADVKLSRIALDRAHSVITTLLAMTKSPETFREPIRSAVVREAEKILVDINNVPSTE